MKKNGIIKICGLSLGCIASSIVGFNLKRNHVDRWLTNNVISYYEEGTHKLDVTYSLKKEYTNYNGYIIENIITKDNSYTVTYINNEDVIDVIDSSNFGIPTTTMNKDYVKAAKRLCLKSH